MSARFIIPALIFFLFISCKKENAGDCFKSNGDIISEVRHPGEFTKIEMNDKIEVTVLKGSEYKVEVFAGKHILKNIATTVSDGVLKVENKNTCNFVRGYKKHVKMTITLPYCYSVLNNGVGALYIEDDFAQDSIRVRAESSGDIHLGGTFNYVKAYSNGNGDLYLAGKCKSLNAYLNGTNYLHAEDLQVSDYLFIQTLSKGDSYLNAANLGKLDYIIYNEGNIYYKGTPLSIGGILETGAKGQVIKED